MPAAGQPLYIPGRDNEWRFQGSGEIAAITAPLAGARATKDGALARDWAVKGHGIVVKSVWDVRADLLARCLQVVLPEWRTPDTLDHALNRRAR